MGEPLGEKEAYVDTRFLRNTGLALVLLTVLAGTIGVFQAVTIASADFQGPSGYSVDVASVD